MVSLNYVVQALMIMMLSSDCLLDAVDGFLVTSSSSSVVHIRHTHPVDKKVKILQMAKEYASISISSDGTVRSTGSLGKPPKKKNKKKKTPKKNKALSKKERQRTANGTMDSNTNASSSSSSVDPSEQGVQVIRGNRGTKSVTIIRGMNATRTEEKKKILKSLKSQLGVGGTLVDGVLELQGSDQLEKVVDLLQGLGFRKTRKVGK